MAVQKVPEVSIGSLSLSSAAYFKQIFFYTQEEKTQRIPVINFLDVSVSKFTDNEPI